MTDEYTRALDQAHETWKNYLIKDGALTASEAVKCEDYKTKWLDNWYANHPEKSREDIYTRALIGYYAEIAFLRERSEGAQ